MSDQHIDPAGNTQQFRAFAQQSEQEEAATPKRSPLLPIIAVVLAIAIVGVGVFLLLR
ncbi:hypothetical protein [Nonomuraea cavernae]|uniref:Uncharacterized protein n=1 Tax=Nonomuraea cavernae TaxID=2045107 RepID=A0A917YY47_9ACTN|nr:hypothetical protein [Nonomuraea cavernae]MCA2185857.1 hypothetical protein [Nonomuraea cavernae]GGO69397.1 hypothetical protein GCM10012289_30450 [Nonomuraea cavernae]